MSISWKEIYEMFRTSPNKIDLVMADSGDKEIIEELNIKEQSALGQILVHASTIVINGYLNILAKDANEEGLVFFNNKIKAYYPGNKLIIAYDVWGGIFSISNGDFDGNAQKIWYYAPDSLMWECLDIDYADFIVWICSENIKSFYKSFLWNEIDSILKKMKNGEGILVYPFLWSNECVIENANKEIVPIEELITLNLEYEKMLN